MGLVERGGSLFYSCRVRVNQHDVAARGGNPLRYCLAHAAGPAGHQRHPPRKLRFRRRERELHQLQRPVLDAECFGVSHGGEAVQRLRAGNVGDGAMVQAPRHTGCFQVTAGCHHAEAGDEDDARIGVEHGLAGPGVSGEVCFVCLRIGGHAVAHTSAEVVNALRDRVPVHKERPVLGVHEMIRTCGAALGEFAGVFAVHKVEHCRRVVVA